MRWEDKSGLSLNHVWRPFLLSGAKEASTIQPLSANTNSGLRIWCCKLLNGVSERMNRTIVERIRCMLSHAKLPKSFWGGGYENGSLFDQPFAISSFFFSGDVPERVRTGKDLSNTWRFLVAGFFFFLFLRMERSKLDDKAKNSVFSWVMHMKNLSTDCGIPRGQEDC